MDQVKAGNHTASIRLAKVGAQKDGTPKVSVCWDVGQKDGIWQDLILKDSATKFLDWQLNVLGVKEKCNLATPDLSSRAESIATAIKSINSPAYASPPKFGIEVSYRPYNGKDYISIAVKSKIDNMAPQGDVNPLSKIDSSEPLPF